MRITSHSQAEHTGLVSAPEDDIAADRRGQQRETAQLDQPVIVDEKGVEHQTGAGQGQAGSSGLGFAHLLIMAQDVAALSIPAFTLIRNFFDDGGLID